MEIVLILLYIEPGYYFNALLLLYSFNFLRFLSCILIVLKFPNFRVSSARLLVNGFLIKTLPWAEELKQQLPDIYVLAILYLMVFILIKGLGRVKD